jgi:hypothetical protein
LMTSYCLTNTVTKLLSTWSGSQSVSVNVLPSDEIVSTAFSTGMRRFGLSAAIAKFSQARFALLISQSFDPVSKRRVPVPATWRCKVHEMPPA